MTTKGRVPSLPAVLAALGPAPEPSTKSSVPSSRSPPVVAGVALAALSRLEVPASPAKHLPTFKRVEGRQGKLLPPDLAAVLDFARRAGAVHLAPLPLGIARLMRIAAGSTEALEHAVRLTGKDPSFLRAAVIFYLERALWTEPGDPYRTLGATAETAQEELAEHMRWLMAWLHRYIGGSEPEALFADRVLGAWQALKSPDPGTAHDQSRPTSVGQEPQPRHQPQIHKRWSLAAAAVVGIVAIAGIAISAGRGPFMPTPGIAAVDAGALGKTEPQRNAR